MTTLLFALAAVTLILGIFFLRDREAFWERVAGAPDPVPPAITMILPTGRPNEAMACPEGFCPAWPEAIASPELALSAEELAERLDAAMGGKEAGGEAASEPDGPASWKRLDDGGDRLRRRYLAHSPLMRFPDLVTVEIVPLGDKRSSLAVHARARLGHSDMGANRKRVRQMLALAQRAAGR